MQGCTPWILIKSGSSSVNEALAEIARRTSKAMSANQISEKIVISNADDSSQCSSETAGLPSPRRRSRRRLTALGWLMLFWCGLLLIFSKTIVIQVVTSVSFRSLPTNVPRMWWLNRFLSIVFNTPLDMFLWGILDPDYGWIGCSIIGLAFSALLFVCLAQVFEGLGFLVYEEELG